MTYTLNNEKKEINELELDELDTVSGGVTREKNKPVSTLLSNGL